MSATDEEVRRNWRHLHEQDVARLERAGFVVLRPFEPQKQYAPGSGHLNGLLVDCETTGLDHETDRMFEVSLVPFTFDEKGYVHAVLDPLTMLEDPGVALSAEVKELTGMTDERLRGQRFDTETVEVCARTAQVVIAHNARFDRPMFERRFPEFAEKPWGCSMNDIPWRRWGVTSASLAYLLMAVGRCHHEAHGAEQDALAVVHILAQSVKKGEDERRVLRLLMDGMKTPHLRIEVNPPRGTNDRIKARRYRAHYIDGKFQFWHKTVPPEEYAVEEEFLRSLGAVDIVARQVTSRDRYSERAL